jgi:DNA-binding CsgD family transcriptional regulator
VLGVLSELELRVGSWEAAEAAGTEAVELGEQTGQSALAYSLQCLARLDAARGREEASRSHAERATDIAGRLQILSLEVFATSALGFLELGLGENEKTISVLEPVRAWVDDYGMRHPAVAQFWPDLIEAYIRSSRNEEARSALASYEQQALSCECVWALASTARCWGLLGDEDAFDEAFAAALSWHAKSPNPFERARTKLVYGERLRRAGRRVEAREQLRSALDTFDRLGATLWSKRASTELRASGERLRRREEQPAQELTPQELQVALMVARGGTNREVAAQLFLSTKTIEFHLRNIYRKLGLRSRTELAHRFAEITSVA